MRWLQFMKPPRLHRGFDWNEAAVNFSMPRPVAFDVPTRLVTAANRAFKRDGERGVRRLLNGPSGPVLRAMGEPFFVNVHGAFAGGVYVGSALPKFWELSPSARFAPIAPAPPALPESLHPFDSILDYQQMLSRRGFVRLGGGSYGSVWGKPAQAWVIKMGSNPEDGWPAYAALVMEKHAANPFAPRIKNLRWHHGKHPFYVAVMERLGMTVNDLNKGSRNWDGAYMGGDPLWQLYQRAYRAVSHWRKGGSGPVSLALIQRRQPELYRLLWDISHELLPQSSLDFHEGNVMVDPAKTRLVVTDPIGITSINTRKSTRRVTSRAIAA